MPQRVISVPFNRLSGGSAIGVFGLAAASVNVTNTQDAGFDAGPFELPEWVDVSRPIEAYATIRTILNSAVSGTGVELRLRVTEVNFGVATTEISVTQDFAVPNPWISTDIRNIHLLGANPNSFPGGTFIGDQLLGMEMQRLSSGIGDTYPQTIGILAFVQLLAYVRCQAVCCC